jgi:hypothetical protein
MTFKRIDIDMLNRSRSLHQRNLISYKSDLTTSTK